MKLNGIIKSVVSGYNPIIFPEPNCSIALISFHSIILDFKPGSSFISNQITYTIDESPHNNKFNSWYKKKNMERHEKISLSPINKKDSYNEQLTSKTKKINHEEYVRILNEILKELRKKFTMLLNSIDNTESYKVYL